MTGFPCKLRTPVDVSVCQVRKYLDSLFQQECQQLLGHQFYCLRDLKS